MQTTAHLGVEAGHGVWRTRKPPSNEVWSQVHPDTEDIVGVTVQQGAAWCELLQHYSQVVYFGVCLWRKLLTLFEASHFKPHSWECFLKTRRSPGQWTREDVGMRGDLRLIWDTIPPPLNGDIRSVINKNLFDPNSRESVTFLQCYESLIQNNQLDVIKILLDVIEFDHETELSTSGTNSLHLAAKVGRTRLVQFFREKRGLHVDTPDEHAQWTALHYAAVRGHLPMATYLLGECDAEVDPIDDLRGFTPLGVAAEEGTAPHIKVASTLIAHGADLTGQGGDIDGNAPLHIAINLGNSDMAKALITQDTDGSSINLQNDEDNTPLHRAAFKDCVDVVKLLLVRDDIVANARDINGRTPLDMAVAMREITGEDHPLDLINALLDYRVRRTTNAGTAVDAQEDYLGINGQNLLGGETVLHASVTYQDPTLIRLLVEKGGANPNIRDTGSKGLTPLHLACDLRYSDVVELLIELGADLGAQV